VAIKVEMVEEQRVVMGTVVLVQDMVEHKLLEEVQDAVIVDHLVLEEVGLVVLVIVLAVVVFFEEVQVIVVMVMRQAQVEEDQDLFLLNHMIIFP
jgi:hypothetical protein